MSENDAVVEAVVDPVVVDESTPPVDETVTSTDESNPPEVKPEKTFTQAELDDILQRRLAKESRKLEKYARANAENQILRKQLEERQAPAIQATGEPRIDQFQDYESYLSALTDWKVEQKMSERQGKIEAERQKAEAKSYEERILNNISEAADKYDDFEEVAFNPKIAITDAMLAAIGEASNGGEIAYYLGKNPKEAADIANMSFVQQVKAIAKLEDKFNQVPQKVITAAPPPIKPNSGNASVQKDPSKMTDKEFAEWRKKQIKQR